MLSQTLIRANIMPSKDGYLRSEIIERSVMTSMNTCYNEADINYSLLDDFEFTGQNKKHQKLFIRSRVFCYDNNTKNSNSDRANPFLAFNLSEKKSILNSVLRI